MNLENLNLVELDIQNLISIDGGLDAPVPPWLQNLGWVYVATQIIENWDDIKAGAAAGWEAGGNH